MKIFAQEVPKHEPQKRLPSNQRLSVNPKVILKENTQNFLSERKKERIELEYGFNSTYLFMIGLIACLIIYYVWIINVNATQGYNIRQLEIEKRNLTVEKQLLDVKIAELESLTNILNNDEVKNMEKVENPDYLVIKEGVNYVYNN
jgi:cell division septal protein FtsQ